MSLINTIILEIGNIILLFAVGLFCMTITKQTKKKLTFSSNSRREIKQKGDSLDFFGQTTTELALSLKPNAVSLLPYLRENNKSFSFNPAWLSSSHLMVLFGHQDSMAIITMLIVAVLVATLIINFIVEQQKNNEAENIEMQECNFNNDKVGKGITKIIPDFGQPSCETGNSGNHNPLNMPSASPDKLRADSVKELASMQITAEQDIEMEFQRSGSLAEPLAAEAPVENRKNGLKVACLVISVSTTGIVSFLAGLSGSRSTTKNKLLFKAGILSMCASMFSALVLLILSTSHHNFSCLILTLRINVWVSTGLMTLAVALLIISYFQMI